MLFLLRAVMFLIRVFVGGAVLGLSLLAITGAFGYFFPLADVFNHFQPFWFFGLIGAMVAAVLIIPFRAGRNPVLIVGLVGLIASGAPLLGEVARDYLHVSPRDSDMPVIRVETRNLFGINYNMRAVARAVAADAPDVLLLQEYYVEQRTALHDLLTPDYPYSLLCTGGKRASLGLYSKIPFTLEDSSNCPEADTPDEERIGRIVATVELDGRPLTLITTHLDWPVQISVLRALDQSWGERIDAMTARKRGEWAELVEVVNAIDGPVALLGDFNSTPWSFEMRRFETNTKLARGTLNLPTFPTLFYIRGWRQTVPLIGLDHVFTRGGAVLFNVDTKPATGSDHLALIADIALVN